MELERKVLNFRGLTFSEELLEEIKNSLRKRGGTKLVVVVDDPYFPIMLERRAGEGRYKILGINEDRPIKTTNKWEITLVGGE